MTGNLEHQRHIKWVDGLRGLASLIVVITHLARAFDPDLFLPTSTENVSPRLLQYPPLRIIPQGRIGVTIFSFVTGFVCALKPLRQIQSGQTEAALIGIAKSAFRRLPRLVFPVTLATVLIWLICQLGGFEISKSVDSWWVGATSPVREERGWVVALRGLGWNLVATWTNGVNAYDGNQWTLWQLLKGSMLVYVTIVGTVFVRAKWRMMIYLGLFVYYYVASDSAFGMQFFWGMFLADLSTHQPAIDHIQSHAYIRTLISPLLILIGLFFASYPEGRPEWMAWSNDLYKLSFYILPSNADIPRFYSGIGLEFLSLGIVFSNKAKEILSHRYLLFLGKNSFAVYLLHGTMLRIVLCWMLFGIRLPDEVQNDAGDMVPGARLKMVGPSGQVVAVGVWFFLLYVLANWWTVWVDPMCARWTARLEKFVCDEGEKIVLPS